MKVMAALETAHDHRTSRVWLWGCVSMDDIESFTWGASLDQLMALLLSQTATWYFHDLKFAGEAMICWLYEHDFHWVDARLEHGKPGEFGTLINSNGVWYNIWIRTDTARIRLIDSLKIIDMQVDEMTTAFGLPERKGEIDRKKKRPLDYMPTLDEVDLLRRDLHITSECLKLLFRHGLTRNTQAANALADYKKIMGDRFQELFPQLPIEDYDIMRHSYHGGWCYLNDKYKGEHLRNGIILDKNSMYTWVMVHEPLPYWAPVHFQGEYQPDPRYPLWIALIRFHFELRPGRFPSIEIKAPGPWQSNQYLSHNMDEDVCLCLTSIDWEVILEQYDVYNVEWIEGWKFRAQQGMFDDYMAKWYSKKVGADIEDNPGLRQSSKIMQVSLYGKFGKSPHQRDLIPSYHAGIVRYAPGEPKISDSIYLPVASFVSAYARRAIIKAAQENHDHFIYADTDSLHLSADTVNGIFLDPYDLDGWKVEARWQDAKYLKQKTYMYIQDGKTVLKCAGLPKGARADISIDQFKIGARFRGKLRPVHLKGGIALLDGWFTILSD